MIRAVIDTNVIVSAIIIKKPSPPLSIWQALRSQQVVLVTTATILAEVEDVLNRDNITKLHGLTAEDIQIILAQLAKTSIIVPLQSIPRVSRDPDDDVFLACAVVGNADCIVSGDKDLLDLRTHEGVEIVSPREFVDTELAS